MMAMSRLVVPILAFACSAHALGAGARTVMEDGDHASTSVSWPKKERCAGQTEVTVFLLMSKSPAQLATLEEAFWNVSNPDSRHYGAHLTTSHITDIVGAAATAIEEVVRWLLGDARAISAKVGIHRDVVEARLTCEAAEAAFATVISTFRHATAPAVVHRASVPYSLPTWVAAHVSMVGDLAHLHVISAPLVARGGATADRESGRYPPTADEWDDEWDTCNGKCGKGGGFQEKTVTPGVLAQAYSLGPAPKSAKGSIAVSQFISHYDAKDVSKFTAACALPAINVTSYGERTTSPVCHIPVISQEPFLCGEALLDIEYAGALVGAIPLTDIQSADTTTFFHWATTVSNMPNPPLVHSVSYTHTEGSSDTTITEANTVFMKLGAMGLSLLFASGDFGVYNSSNVSAGTPFNPLFPASSPFVTSVGGTEFVTSGVIGEEKAWNSGGGGFSNIFPRPAYQADAVAAYLSAAGSILPPGGSLWNSSGRAYPDVSALAGLQNPYCLHAGQMFTAVGGTSAATPVLAAVVAKLNEVRLARGDRPLGFLNPWLYKRGFAGFSDVKVGRNCDLPANETCPLNVGFPAVQGWDAATGFGTPNFERLAKLV